MNSEDVDHLIYQAVRHYDGKCRAAADDFLLGWKSYHLVVQEVDPPEDIFVVVSIGRLELLCKILEQAGSNQMLAQELMATLAILSSMRNEASTDLPPAHRGPLDWRPWMNHLVQNKLL
jgi:hypothetical protein